ncbi:MAG: sulfotransferase domain-containing protein [Candidatus Sulfotelmatobacter sp.]
MIKWLIGGTKRAFGLHNPGRNLDVLPDDTFLVSYPKSGNTWTRFLIANLRYPEKHPDFSNINELIPDSEALSKRRLNQLSRPRILKSHQYFDPRYQKVLYVVRDPRDVVLAEYHFQIKCRLIEEEFPLRDFVTRFLSNQLGHRYGSWFDNVGSWFFTRGDHPGFLLTRYEALHSQAVPELARIAKFLGIHADPEKLAFAVAQSSAERMREMEKKQAHLWSSTRNTRLDKPFVRDAKAGGWRTELPQECVARIEAAWGGLMSNLGYELAVTAVV